MELRDAGEVMVLAFGLRAAPQITFTFAMSREISENTVQKRLVGASAASDIR